MYKMLLELSVILKESQILPQAVRAIPMNVNSLAMTEALLFQVEVYLSEVAPVQVRTTPISPITENIGCKTKLSKESLLYLLSLSPINLPKIHLK